MLSTNLVKSMDLVELNPELDVNEQTNKPLSADHRLYYRPSIRNLNSMVYDKSVKRKSPCSG